MSNSIIASFAAFVLIASIAAQAVEPATAPGFTDPKDAPVLSVWPDAPVSGRPAFVGEPGETVVERGKNGHHNRVIHDTTRASLSVFLPAHPDPARTAVIVCPGGGYEYVVIDNEGYTIAKRLNESGIAAFVLKYRLPDPKQTARDMLAMPIQDVLRAVQIVRADASKWNLDPNHIGVMGFSAGGNVAANAATHFGAGDPSASDPVAQVSSRPDFVALLYPVVSMRKSITHAGSRHNLLGDDPSAELVDRYSGELNVTAQTPPLFIAHAKDDKAVPAENSILMADAARRAGGSPKLLLFPSGGHGFALGRQVGGSSAWFGQFELWLRDMKMLSSESPTR